MRTSKKLSNKFSKMMMVKSIHYTRFASKNYTAFIDSFLRRHNYSNEP